MAMLVASHDELDLLDLAGLLRKVMCDKHSLMDTANVRKIKVRFEVGCFGPSFGPGDDPYWEYVAFQSLEDGIDPQTSPGGRTLTLNKDDFLKHEILYIYGKAHTVRDVIRFATNVAGGVHHDPNPNREYRLIKAASETLTIGGLPASIRQLKAITRVTLRGLEPLIEDLRAHL